jgi:hypothetical protein
MTRSVTRDRQAILAICAAAFLLTLWNVHDQYFTWDEWAYWIERVPLLDHHEYSDYFFLQHVGHIHAATMLVWLPLERLFGAKTYLPYVMPTVAANCAAGFLLYELLRSIQIRIAVALAATALYLALGNGGQNVNFGWQLCFVLPIAMCFLALLTIQSWADEHPGRSAAVIGFSMLVAVLASNVGITAVVVVTSLALMQRRFRLAAVAAIPSALAYLTWRHNYQPDFQPIESSQLGSYFDYATDGIRSAVEGILQVDVGVIAWLVLAAALAAAVWAWRNRPASATVLAATLLGLAFFYITLSTQRAGLDSATFGAGTARYLHVASALLLPSLAFLADRILNTRWTALPLALLAIWMVAANWHDFEQLNDPYVVDGGRIRNELAATAALGQRLDSVDGGLAPYGSGAPQLTIETVRRMDESDQLPCSTDYVEIRRMAAKLRVRPPRRSQVACS